MTPRPRPNAPIAGLPSAPPRTPATATNHTPPSDARPHGQNPPQAGTRRVDQRIPPSRMTHDHVARPVLAREQDRRGGHLLTRALSPPNKTGLPTLLHSRRPCPGRSHRRPTTPHSTSGDEADGTGGATVFHTVHEQHRELELPAAEDHQESGALPERR